MKTDKKLFKDFLKFSQLQIRTWDIDPAYPVLREVYRMRDLEGEEALWHTAVYVAFYNLGSAEYFINIYPKPTTHIIWGVSLPTGTERRGFRGQPHLVKKHLQDVARRIPLVKWVSRMTSWTYVRDEYSNIKYGGTWSSYKFADLLKWVHGVKITAPDFGVGGGGEKAGPIAGMSLLTGYDRKDCLNADLQNELYDLCVDRMEYPFEGMDQCETCLCDFNSMADGRYYTGHDIDQQQAVVKTANSVYLSARREVFDKRLLGEDSGWIGVRKKLNTLYYETGQIYDPFS